MHSATHILLHFRLLLRWVVFGALLGVIMGLVGAAFVHCIHAGTAFRESHPWVLLTLPVGGLLIVWLYRITRNHNDKGTNMVIASIRSEAELPMQMAPLIFISTIITHTCGGSAGREGAALQLGGSIGSMLGKGFKLRERDRRILILAGMSAAFSAIFRTPIAAAIFAMEVGCIGAMHYAALVPCAVASLTASFTAEQLGLPLSHYNVAEIPELTAGAGLKIVLLGVLCAGVSIAFCTLLHKTEHLLEKKFPNPYLRILTAAFLLLGLGLVFRTTDFFGIGETAIHGAIAGETVWYAFLVKMLFTAVTIGGGFKGGEIVPSFFIGATFGCLFGQIAGLSPSLCAAAGMMALFCGVTNCPLATLFISAELFGMECVPFCLLVIAVSYLLSGYYGLYSEQKFMYSKFADAPVHHRTRQ
ncbi:MAG: chloride channel protein [Oscillospiraceae bacterium]|nr:chloride channel protein [Oscillospiraceae bacterium]